jgi:energy-coupling factor transport system permease protein
MSFLNVTLGQYYPARSFIHGLDPRLKIMSLAVLMILTFMVSAPGAVFMHSAAVLGCVLASGVPVGVFLRGLRLFFFLFLFTAVLHLFFTPGTPVFTLPGPLPLSVTGEGLMRGALVSWRLLAVIGLSSLLTYTTSPLTITRGLEALMSPLSRFRFPVQDFSLMMMMAIRFIPILTSETERVWKAQKSRGADLRSGGLKKRASTLMSVILPVFTGLFRRADDLALALEARGYVPGRLRTSMRPLRWSSSDSVALAVLVVWSVVLAACYGCGIT